MKRGSKLLVMAGALAVLAGAWTLAETMAREQREALEQASEPEVISLAAGEAEEIIGLRWEFEGETVSLRKDEDGRWLSAEDPDCPIDPGAAARLVTAAAGMTAGTAISRVTDYAQYGLDVPALTVTVETADHEVTYAVGGKTLAGEYYVRAGDTNTVYTEHGTLLPAFSLGLRELILLEEAPGDVETVTKLVVETDVTDYVLQRSTVGTPGWTAERGEETVPLSDEGAEVLYGQVKDIAFDELVCWDGKRPGDFGLDTPQGRASMTYVAGDGTEKVFSLEFGDYTDGGIFVRLAGSDRVYTAAGSVLDTLMYPSWDSLAPLAVLPVEPASVAGAEISLGGHVYRVEIIREEKAVTGSDGATSLAETVCYVSNGWTLDAEAAAAWFEMLLSLAAEEPAGDAVGREALLSVTVLGTDGARTELTLRSYDSGRCLCVVDGGAGYFVSRNDTEALSLTAESLLILE